MKPKTTTFEITTLNILGVVPIEEVEITYQWVNGYPETRDTPGEPDGYVINRVLWRNVDITRAMRSGDLNAIAELLKENE